MTFLFNQVFSGCSPFRGSSHMVLRYFMPPEKRNKWFLGCGQNLQWEVGGVFQSQWPAISSRESCGLKREEVTCFLTPLHSWMCLRWLFYFAPWDSSPWEKAHPFGIISFGSVSKHFFMQNMSVTSWSPIFWADRSRPLADPNRSIVTHHRCAKTKQMTP